ncbi:iron ABC transporter ATP-binding protein [Candidatus Poribacteria bacterium]|nr:MAG: iron ABC transporter ATP-binding protein [Candidatus Poribacteria bacterium]
MQPLLSIRNITKRFARNLPPVVEDLCFEVYAGEIFALLGPSGCGKTTTLRLIAGFERANAGEICVDGQCFEGARTHLPPEARDIGIVFQEYALFPHLNVSQNVAFGLKKLPTKLRDERVMTVLEMVSMTAFKDRKPHELSGGQQQRVALARSIAPSPKLILLDEPFSNLDAGMRHSTREEIRTLLKEAGMSAVVVTHDQEEALCFADRLGVMSDGRIEQIGIPETVYHRPQTPFVADFLGATNLIDGEAEGNCAETPLGKFQIAPSARGKVLLSIRPEHLVMVQSNGTGQNNGVGEIVMRDFKGHDLTYRVRIGTRNYVVQTDYCCPLQVGAQVTLQAVEPAVVVKQEEPLP